MGTRGEGRWITHWVGIKVNIKLSMETTCKGLDSANLVWWGGRGVWVWGGGVGGRWISHQLESVCYNQHSIQFFVRRKKLSFCRSSDVGKGDTGWISRYIL